MKFWTSFYFVPNEENKGDYRPLTHPPTPGILGWWDSGTRMSDDASTLVIWVEAENEEKAKELIGENWPEAKAPDCEWRFFQPNADQMPSDRFPLSSWSKERLGLVPTP